MRPTQVEAAVTVTVTVIIVPILCKCKCCFEHPKTGNRRCHKLIRNEKMM